MNCNLLWVVFMRLSFNRKIAFNLNTKENHTSYYTDIFQTSKLSDEIYMQRINIFIIIKNELIKVLHLLVTNLAKHKMYCIWKIISKYLPNSRDNCRRYLHKIELLWNIFFLCDAQRKRFARLRNLFKSLFETLCLGRESNDNEYSDCYFAMA